MNKLGKLVAGLGVVGGVVGLGAVMGKAKSRLDEMCPLVTLTISDEDRMYAYDPEYCLRSGSDFSLDGKCGIYSNKKGKVVSYAYCGRFYLESVNADCVTLRELALSLETEWFPDEDLVGGSKGSFRLDRCFMCSSTGCVECYEGFVTEVTLPTIVRSLVKK